MPSSVDAHTTAMSATDPLVIHILVPFSTQSDPSRSCAVVIIVDGSLPWSGSVSPKQPIASPAAMRGSHSCFCSSEPYFQIGNMASDPWTETRLRSPESAASSSRQATPYAIAPMPGAAVAGQVHAQQAELAQLRGQLAGERPGLEPVGDVRHDPLGGEVADRVADQPLLVAEFVVDAEQVDCGGGVGGAGHGWSSLRRPASGLAASVRRADRRGQPRGVRGSIMDL